VKTGDEPEEVKKESNRAKANMNRKKEEEKKVEEKKDNKIMIRKRLTLEPELDATELQINFIDECFGEGAGIEYMLEEAL